MWRHDTVYSKIIDTWDFSIYIHTLIHERSDCPVMIFQSHHVTVSTNNEEVTSMGAIIPAFCHELYATLTISFTAN